jgi:hypothetical protein
MSLRAGVFCSVEPLWNQEQAKLKLPRRREYRNLGGDGRFVATPPRCLAVRIGAASSDRRESVRRESRAG